MIITVTYATFAVAKRKREKNSANWEQVVEVIRYKPVKG